MKEIFYKGFKGWVTSYSKCPECDYYAFQDDINDDYWRCKYCGYSHDKIMGRIHHGKYYKVGD